jgi:hypothetical protein
VNVGFIPGKIFLVCSVPVPHRVKTVIVTTSRRNRMHETQEHRDLASHAIKHHKTPQNTIKCHKYFWQGTLFYGYSRQGGNSLGRVKIIVDKNGG